MGARKEPQDITPERDHLRAVWVCSDMSFATLPRVHSLTDLPNISFALGEELRRAGIRQPMDLLGVGAEEAWSRVRLTGLHDNIQALLALEGAIQGIKWHLVGRDRRAELVRFATQALPVVRAA